MWPTREHHPDLTGGVDTHMGKAAHSGDVAGTPGKEWMRQPTNKPTMGQPRT
jgi:hypothetical protein